MALLYGKEYSKLDILRLVGDMSQLAGATNARISGGRGDLTQIVEVKTGTGLHYMVVPGRGMDICSLSYCGYGLSFVSKTGIVNAAHYETDYDGFHRSFFAGMLTTCGLRNIGGACVDEGEYVGLHGRINNTPAEDVCVENGWEDDAYVTRIRGRMRESKLYGENLTLSREITSKLGSNTVELYDTIENCGSKEEPFTLLYHCNFGFPLLDVGSEVIVPAGIITPRDEIAEKAVAEYNKVEPPQNDYPETVFFHKPKAGRDGTTYAGMFNPNLGENGVGLIISYNQNELPYLVQWKNMGNGDYVMALEPGNCYPQGRKTIRAVGMLPMLAGGEKRNITLKFQVVTSKQELAACCVL